MSESKPKKFKVGDRVVPVYLVGLESEGDQRQMHCGKRVYTVAEVREGTEYGDWFSSRVGAGLRDADDYELAEKFGL